MAKLQNTTSKLTNDDRLFLAVSRIPGVSYVRLVVRWLPRQLARNRLIHADVGLTWAVLLRASFWS